MNKPVRWFDFYAIFLLTIAFLVGPIRLAVTEWTNYLEGATYLTVFGLALGITLGYSRFRPRTVTLLALAYSLFFIPWYLGTTMAKPIAWSERLLSILGRFLISLEQLFSRQPVKDPILFLVAMLILYWTISLLAGYHLVRYGRPWIPLAAAGIALILMEYYVNLYLPGKISAFYIAIFILSSILLVTSIHFLNSSRKWQSTGVQVESEARSDLIRGAFVAILFSFLITWNIPTVIRILTPGTEERATFNARWDRFASKFQNVVAPLSGPQVVQVNYTGDTSVLGSGQPLSATEIFQARTTLPASSSMVYYWRARSYDSYQNGRWESTVLNRESYTPESGDLPYADWYGRVESKIFVTALSNLRTIYLPGQPITLSRPSMLVMLRLADETIEINTITVDTTLRPGELFEAKVSVANPTIHELRNAGTDYPREISSRYLQLPSSLPTRIKTLAEKIVRGQTTPYDQAVAITEYLRQEMAYVSPVPTPPSGQDPVDWFLFTNKAGFCQYYASAEVLLLRALGIPARYSVGYAEGEPDETRLNFIVRESDSHAWPEVYFPGIGWVEFEPTVVLTEISRNSGETVADNGTTPNGENMHNDVSGNNPADNLATGKLPGVKPPIPTKPVRNMTAMILIISIPSTILLAGIIYLNRKRLALIPYWIKRQILKHKWRIPAWLNRLTLDEEQVEKEISASPPFAVQILLLLQKYHLKVPGWLLRWVAWSKMDPFERSFSSVGWAITRLGGVDDPALTPSERVKVLCQVLPQSATAAERLLDEYQKSTYSPQPGNILQARQAARHIRRLGWRAWWANLFSSEHTPARNANKG